jgi:hypothetical protein
LEQNYADFDHKFLHPRRRTIHPKHVHISFFIFAAFIIIRVDETFLIWQNLIKIVFYKHNTVSYQ